MRVAAKIRRLEKLAGVGQRCARCRLYLRQTGGTPTQPAGETITATCPDCGTAYKLALTGTPREREAQRRLKQYTDEDIYTDPIAHALYLWWHYRPAMIILLNRQREKERSAKSLAVQKASPGARLRAQLFADFGKRERRKRERLTTQYGQRFPELDELSAQMQNYGSSWAGQKPVAARAELECVIWGEPLPETVEELERMAREAQEKAEAETRKKAEAQAERERRNQELLERNRRTVAESNNRYGGPGYSPDDGFNWVTGR